MSAAAPLRLLLVEDSADDAFLVLRHLQRQGLEVDAVRVGIRSQIEALEPGASFQIVLCDYHLPGMDGLEALEMVREKYPDAPCILLSGEIGEEQAADALRIGARDFVSKGRLSRLVPAIRRELQEAEDRRAREALERSRLQMEVQLRQAQKLEAIGQLAAGIAHEINTPTQFIGDNATFLRASVMEILTAFRDLEQRLRRALETLGDAPGLEAMETMLRVLDVAYLEAELPRAIDQTMDGVARVARIVSAMKDFSHPSSDYKEPTDLNRAIESTLTVSRNEWKYVAELELDLDPELPLVPCFPGEFNQVVLNLVVNAAHAIEEALGGRNSGRMGRLRVATRRQGDRVLMEIEDTGLGIPAAIRDRIFDPFFTTKPVGKGTGQGLAIAHAVIVEKHGGQIEVVSEAGLGSTFRIFLPLSGGSDV